MCGRIFSPLLTVAVYTIVFSMFLKIKFGQKGTSLQFATYLLCGILPDNVLLPLWMPSSPIFYPEELIPPNFAFILKVNPMAVLIKLYREAMIRGLIPGQGVWSWVGIPCLAVVFMKYFILG